MISVMFVNWLRPAMLTMRRRSPPLGADSPSRWCECQSPKYRRAQSEAIISLS